jgi:hypothetical protein
MQDLDDHSRQIQSLRERGNITKVQENEWLRSLRLRHSAVLREVLAGIGLIQFEIEEIIVRIFQVEPCLYPLQKCCRGGGAARYSSSAAPSGHPRRTRSNPLQLCRSKVPFGTFCARHSKLLDRRSRAVKMTLDGYGLRDISNLIMTLAKPDKQLLRTYYKVPGCTFREGDAIFITDF